MTTIEEFYAAPFQPSIQGRRIVFTTPGGSTTSTTRAQLAKDIADIETRLATKVRSDRARETLEVTLSLYRKGLAMARENGL